MSSELTPVLVPALVAPAGLTESAACQSPGAFCLKPPQVPGATGMPRDLEVTGYLASMCSGAQSARRTSIFHHSLPLPTLFSFRFLVSLPFCEHHSTRTQTQHCLGQRTRPYEVSAQFMSLWQSEKDRTSPLGHKIPWQASWTLGI